MTSHDPAILYRFRIDPNVDPKDDIEQCLKLKRLHIRRPWILLGTGGSRMRVYVSTYQHLPLIYPGVLDTYLPVFSMNIPLLALAPRRIYTTVPRPHIHACANLSACATAQVSH